MELDSTDGTVLSVTAEVIKKPLSVAPTEADVTYIKMEDVKGWFITSALTSPDVDAIERFLSGARSFGKGPWKIKSIDAMRSFLSPKGPDYLTKVTRVMDDCEAKDISALKITYKGDTKGLNDARGEMVKLVEPGISSALTASRSITLVKLLCVASSLMEATSP